MPSTDHLVKPDNIETRIHFIRGRKVMLDSDLAELYGVETKYLLRQVNRNADRFPSDFMFSLDKKEVARLRCQIGTSKGRGGRRYTPYAFTEQGVAMLSGVLRSVCRNTRPPETLHAKLLMDTRRSDQFLQSIQQFQRCESSPETGLQSNSINSVRPLIVGGRQHS